MKKKPIIKLTDICFSYDKDKPVLDHLDFSLYKGDRIGLIAPNGSGKTTLFHVIMGLQKPDAGKIEIFGKEVKTEKDFIPVRRKIGLLFQDADDQLFSPTVIEDVAFGPLNMGRSKEEAIEISKKVLGFLGLSGFEKRVTFKLSGGEKKLVSLATVLAMEPEVLLLDEPLTGLDIKTCQTIVTILSKLDLTWMIISHDIDFLDSVCNTILTMEKGKIVKDTTIRYHHHDHAHPLGHIPHKHE